MVFSSRFPVLSSAQCSVFGCAIVLGAMLMSCGSDEQPTNNDSAKDTVANELSTTREVETDSGKLIITHFQDREIDDVVLMDASGKIRARGLMFDNKITGAWLRYDEQGNVITAVQYSEGIPAQELDAGDFKTKRVKYKEMGISFAVPVQWDTISPFNPKQFVSYEKNVNDPTIMMKPNINIAKGTLEAGQTLETMAAEQLNMLHQTVGRVELVDEAYLSIDSSKAFRRYGMYYTENNKVGFLDAIIVNGNDVYVISCAAQNREQGEFLKYQAVFENLVMSVQFTD